MVQAKAKLDRKEARIVNGRAMADQILEELQAGVAVLKDQTGMTPGLAMISVGEDFPRQVFFRRQQVASNRVGVSLFALCLPHTTSQGEILGLMERLNTSPWVHGILIQLPLPAHLEATAIFQALDPRKDVDGLHPLNIGELLAGTAALVPVTLSAILEILERSGAELRGKRTLILGRPEGFAKPLAMLLVNRFATVSVGFQWDDGVVDLLREAEILIMDLYRPHCITGEMIRPGSLVIDLAFNSRQGRLIGDVEPSSASRVAALLSPVPGGVGPLIVSMLLKNTVMAYRRQVLGLEVEMEEIWRRGR